MRRGIVLGLLIAVGAMSMAGAAAQAPQSGLSAAVVSATKIEKVKDNLFVVFPALRTMHMGDMFPWKDAPFLDLSNGGSGVDRPDEEVRRL